MIKEVEFYERFELLDLLRDDGVKTFRARDVASGKDVEAHIFVNPHAPLSAALLARLNKLPEQEAARVLDRGKYQGTVYVVTHPITDYPSLREWLSSKKPMIEGSPQEMGKAGAWQIKPVTPAPQQQGTPVGEFTRFMRNAAPSAGPPPPKVSLPPQGASQVEHTAQILPGSTPATGGEFTQMFAAKPPAPAPQGNAPGEFTQMFQAAPPVQPVAPPPPAPAPPAPSPSPSTAPMGEFTRMFQAPGAAPAAPPPAAPSGPPPGEFTQMLRAQKDAPPPPPAAPPAPKVGEFTQMLQAAELKMAPGAPPPAPQAAPPGEFTRMMRTALPAKNPPSFSPPPAPAPPAPSFPPLTPANSALGAGEFAQFFQSPAGPMPSSPVLNQPLRPQAPGGAGPNRVGEFTQIFGKGDLPAQPPAGAPLITPGPSTATGAFSVPVPQPVPVPVAHPQPAAVPQPMPAAPPAPPPGYALVGTVPPGFVPPANTFTPPPPPGAFAAQNPLPAGMQAPPVPLPVGTMPAPPPGQPGDFTQAFSRPAQLSLGQPSAPVAAPQAPLGTLPPLPPAPSWKKKLPLYVAIGGGVLAIVLLILVLVTRK